MLIFFLFAVLRIGVQPPTVEINAVGGKHYYVEVNFYNMGTVPCYIKVWVQDIGIDTISGSIIPYKGGSTFYSCAKWIKLKPDFFYTKPKQKKKIKVRIDVPMNAKGGYCALLVFGTADRRGSTKGFGIEVTTNILIKVDAEDIKPKLNFTEIKVYKKKRNYIIIFSAENSSNIYTRVEDILQIKDKRGKTIKEFKKEGHTFLPPFTKKIYRYIWKRPKKGFYTAIGFIEYEGNYEVLEKNFMVK